jgi:hypothetical protein
MAIRFFWRCESLTLDPVHDFTVGADTTATKQFGTETIGPPGLVGENGFIRTTDNRMRFDTNTTFLENLSNEGAIAFIHKQSTWQHASSLISLRFGATYRDVIRLSQRGSDGTGIVPEYGYDIAGARGFNYDLPGKFQADVVYGIILRWRKADVRLTIEVYNDLGELLGFKTQTFPSFIPLDETADRFDSFGIGGDGIGTMDNIFVADSYDEPLQNNLFITSYTEYTRSLQHPLLISQKGDSLTNLEIDTNLELLDKNLVRTYSNTPRDVSTAYEVVPVPTRFYDGSAYREILSATTLTTLTWNAAFRSQLVLPTELALGETLEYTAIYNETDNLWDIVTMEVL